jgi:predicted nucleotidyltransferase
MFGSAARGDGDTRSDIDLFVVRPADVPEDNPDWRDQLDRLSDHVHDWTGNRAALSEVSVAHVRRLRRDRPPVVEELRRDAITLAGPAPIELLGTTKCGGVTVHGAERLVAGTAREATPGERAWRFHGDRSQPAAGRA